MAKKRRGQSAAFMRSINPHFHKRKHHSMAKRKHSRKSRSRRSFGSENLMTPVMSGLIYGAGRSYLSNIAVPITSKIPAGAYADNVLFGAAAYYGAKKNVMGMKGACKAILAIEAAMVGAKALNGISGGSSSEAGF
jgi:hypothetical protein